MRSETEYTLFCDRHGQSGSVTIKGRLLKDVLQKHCRQCIEEDDTGIYFEIGNADMEWCRKQPGFHIVTVKEGVFGIILKGVEIRQPYRNQYLLDLRAKREWLGLTVEDMACMTQTADYKERENGHRKVSIDEYARFMAVLQDFEEEKRTGAV